MPDDSIPHKPSTTSGVASSADHVSTLLIEAVELRKRLAAAKQHIFDVRYVLSDTAAGIDAYREGHIPGAHFLDQGSDLAGPSTGHNGRHPLPDRNVFIATLNSYGLSKDDDIIVYDEHNGSFAARAWWLLRWAGFTQVRLLNGGWQAWLRAGGPRESGTGRKVATQTLSDTEPSTTATIQVAELHSQLGQAQFYLLDARDAQRYRGEHEPLDPVAGHIPGALNRPIAQNLEEDGRFKPAAHLRQEFIDLFGGEPTRPVVHYCGSGITACHNLFAMELAGLTGGLLYPGSWSEWCADPARPIARF